MNKHLEELKKDFDEMTEKLDLNGYNPLSPEVQKIINIGMLYLVYEKLKKAHEKKLNDDFTRAEDELMGSETYYEMYMAERNPTLKSMASQEASHSKYFIDKLRMMTKNNEEEARYKQLLAWYNSLVEKINK